MIVAGEGQVIHAQHRFVKILQEVSVLAACGADAERGLVAQSDSGFKLHLNLRSQQEITNARRL